MKKLSIFPILLIFVFSLCSCGGDNTRYDAIYDTETKQYISWGDTRETVIEAFGEGIGPGEYYKTSEYDVNVEYFSDDNTVNEFRFGCLTNGRYKVLGIASEEEFTKKFPNANFFEAGSLRYCTLCIYTDKSNGKYYLSENSDITIPANLILAYEITVMFNNEHTYMDWHFSNCMLDEEYEYYSSLKDHTIKDVQIIKE